jgi:hypothetical protein
MENTYTCAVDENGKRAVGTIFQKNPDEGWKDSLGDDVEPAIE